MLAAFLPPYPFRATAAPYLWWYYRLLGEWAGESAYFIMGRDYVRPIATWADRWECTPEAGRRLSYDLPADLQPAQHYYAWLDESRFTTWLSAHAGNPLAVFRYFLCERDSEYETELMALIDHAPEPLEAVITFCNIPSLSAVCRQRGIPLIHQELGPMRGPIYRETGYVDFRGVNGNTEAAAREQALGLLPLSELSLHDLLGFFLQDPTVITRLPTPCNEVGVVLQVEDDSNLVAFGNGMDNLALIRAAGCLYSQNEIRVRPHPGSLFSLQDGMFARDNSKLSLHFVAKSHHVMTINSSVGLEALFLGRSVTIFGDNPVRHLSFEQPDSPTLRCRLAFYLFGYLVPRICQLSPDYLRFRLGKPDELAIMAHHLDCYMNDDEMTLPEALHDGDFSARLKAQVWASNQLRQQHEERLQALMLVQHDTNQQLQALGEAHALALETLQLRDTQLAEVQQHLMAEGLAHGHAIEIVQARDKQLDELNNKVNAIRRHRLLRWLINRFVTQL